VTRLLFPAAVALALALVLGAPARAAAAPTVARVLVEGNRRVEDEAVKSAISTKAGEPLESRKINDDIKALMRLGFFADVVVEERGDPEKPSIVFRVSERPAVR